MYMLLWKFLYCLMLCCCAGFIFSSRLLCLILPIRCCTWIFAFKMSSKTNNEKKKKTNDKPIRFGTSEYIVSWKACKQILYPFQSSSASNQSMWMCIKYTYHTVRGCWMEIKNKNNKYIIGVYSPYTLRMGFEIRSHVKKKTKRNEQGTNTRRIKRTGKKAGNIFTALVWWR